MKKILFILLTLVIATAIFCQVAYQNVYTTPLSQKGKTWVQAKGVITSSANANAQSYSITYYGYGQVVYYAVSGGTIAVSANFLSPGTTTQFDPNLTTAEVLVDLTGTGMTLSSPTIITFTLQKQTIAPTTVYYSIGGWR